MNRIKKFNENDIIYIVEQRYIEQRKCKTGVSCCFVSFSIDKIINWINDNKDFDTNNSNWYWAVLKCVIDDEFGAEIYKYFDIDGNELKEQPF